MALTPRPPLPQPGDDLDTWNLKMYNLVTWYGTNATEMDALQADVLAKQADVNTNAGLALGYKNAAAQSVTDAATQVTYAANQVTLATNQVTAATTQATNAASSAASALNAPGTSATSTTSLTVGTGVQTLTIQTGKLFTAGQVVVIPRTSDPSGTYMQGRITSHNSSTGALVVNVTITAGAGTFTDWTIALGAISGVTSVDGQTGAVKTRRPHLALMNLGVT